jgi:Flp pilus assembly protein TadD
MYLHRASALEPGNPQAMYQRSLVYQALGKHELARRELLAVHEQAPQEPSILVALGKVCKQLARLDDAVRVVLVAPLLSSLRLWVLPFVLSWQRTS